MTAPEWTVVIPLKGSARAKTRLALPASQRRAWARAFAVDTVAAAVACPVVRRVVVVTDDSEWRASPPEGSTVVVDDAEVNAAIRHAVGGDPVPVAALPGDLPALRPGDLQAALVAAGRRAPRVLADRAGSGTVLLTAPSGPALNPAFGSNSYAGHIAGGAVALRDGGWPGLRCDVDTLADLAEALRVGVGAATSAAARR
ncbi:MAG: 2-phospho-L-lactate guanylyltransferase [Actinomycetota bacterium]|nr:2-phospho-L-lactate guanylyltransferase [Actinomycetota bacterium]